MDDTIINNHFEKFKDLKSNNLSLGNNLKMGCQELYCNLLYQYSNLLRMRGTQAEISTIVYKSYILGRLILIIMKHMISPSKY